MSEWLIIDEVRVIVAELNNKHGLNLTEVNPLNTDALFYQYPTFEFKKLRGCGNDADKTKAIGLFSLFWLSSSTEHDIQFNHIVRQNISCTLYTYKGQLHQKVIETIDLYLAV